MEKSGVGRERRGKIAAAEKLDLTLSGIFRLVRTFIFQSYMCGLTLYRSTIHIFAGNALFKYCKYPRACTKGILFRTSMYKMYAQETYCY